MPRQVIAERRVHLSASEELVATLEAGLRRESPYRAVSAAHLVRLQVTITRPDLDNVTCALDIPGSALRQVAEALMDLDRACLAEQAKVAA